MVPVYHNNWQSIW